MHKHTIQSFGRTALGTQIDATLKANLLLGRFVQFCAILNSVQTPRFAPVICPTYYAVLVQYNAMFVQSRRGPQSALQ